VRTLGQNGLDLIQHFEGCRLTVYLDSAGLETVGTGHLVTSQDNLHLGDTITQAQADAFLEQDLSAAVACVDAHCPNLPTRNARAALVSLAFNIGCTAFANSTLEKLVNAGDMNGASEQFQAWTRAGHTHPRGILIRRLTERDLFLAPDGPMPDGWLTAHNNVEVTDGH